MKKSLLCIFGTGIGKAVLDMGLLFLITGMLLSACSLLPATSSKIDVTITADGKEKTYSVDAGSTVQQALNQAGIQLGNLDRVDPASLTVATAGTSIRVIRVTETYDVAEISIPFDQQTVKNESLPAGQSLLVQAGENGVQQTTYRHVLEDGVEVSKDVFKVTTLKEPVPEIYMVGVQSPFSPIQISGKLAYISSGNAWVMEGTTGVRTPIVTTGDLDGYIFNLSPDGKWLLFTRHLKDDDTNINSLWVSDLSNPNRDPISLGVDNIYHFAGWVPGEENTITYSTVVPKTSAPGWQANNDLHVLTFNNDGTITRNEMIIDTNGGGVYGWWGTTFAWSPDGKNLAFARADGVGLLDFQNHTYNTLFDLTPYNTRNDWAWVPGIDWSPDSSFLYYVDHITSTGDADAQSSTQFDTVAADPVNGTKIDLAPQAGMFAYPVASPSLQDGHYYVAYLQSIFPDQSDTSRYHLVIMDRDGSNRKVLFPPEGSVGLDPQSVVWAPEQVKDSPLWIAVIYQDNLWLIDPVTGNAQQVTGDGTISRIDWN
ncbi:MAG TPA: G5 domain-containing protein [Longilinea sp.]|nr:G5 domain-containing protein [Longilinea sp.]